LLPEDVRGNAIVYPAPEDMARGEFETDLGPAVKAYEECWMRLKTSSQNRRRMLKARPTGGAPFLSQQAFEQVCRWNFWPGMLFIQECGKAV
jgi:hypothetical protein